ncbi:MAG: hypothetical protein D6775_09185, partial [Caldilineae bacterium]
ARRQEENVSLIKIVGICGSGKSTLARRLQALGYNARQVSQEHSGVPTLWRRRQEPDLLVYLDVSDEEARRRYPHLNLDARYLARERRRLAHARAHADCYIHTDGLTPEQVLERVLRCLQAKESQEQDPFVP